MIAILSAVLLSAALPEVPPETVTQAAEVQTVEVPAPLPAVRPKKVEKVEEPVRPDKRRERETPVQRIEEPPKPRSETPRVTPVEVVAPPVEVPAPPVASPQAVPDPIPAYGKQRSIFRDVVLPLAMLAAGAFVLARVLRKAT
jgi:hypothetical protein